METGDEMFVGHLQAFCLWIMIIMILMIIKIQTIDFLKIYF